MGAKARNEKSGRRGARRTKARRHGKIRSRFARVGKYSRYGPEAEAGQEIKKSGHTFAEVYCSQARLFAASPQLRLAEICHQRKEAQRSDYRSRFNYRTLRSRRTARTSSYWRMRRRPHCRCLTGRNIVCGHRLTIRTGSTMTITVPTERTGRRLAGAVAPAVSRNANREPRFCPLRAFRRQIRKGSLCSCSGSESASQACSASRRKDFHKTTASINS